LRAFPRPIPRSPYHAKRRQQRSENYTKVGDGLRHAEWYPLTDLISAQDASLNAELSQAQATFTFLIDFADTLRVSNSFDVLLDPQTREPWYSAVDAWFGAHGISIATH